MGKHTSLLRKFVTYGRKIFITFGQGLNSIPLLFLRHWRGPPYSQMLGKAEKLARDKQSILVTETEIKKKVFNIDQCLSFFFVPDEATR